MSTKARTGQPVRQTPITKQCDRRRRLLTDHPQMVEKFEQWMVYRNQDVKTAQRAKVVTEASSV